VFEGWEVFHGGRFQAGDFDNKTASPDFAGEPRLTVGLVAGRDFRKFLRTGKNGQAGHSDEIGRDIRAEGQDIRTNDQDMRTIGPGHMDKKADVEGGQSGQ